MVPAEFFARWDCGAHARYPVAQKAMPSYYVIGDDGNRYGPADLGTLQQWIIEKRLTPETQLQDSESGDRMGAATVPGLNFSGSSSTVQSQGATGTMFQAGATAQENNPYSKTPGGSPYYRQGGGTQNYGQVGFPADKGVGITIIVLSSCGLLAAGIIILGGGAMASMGGSLNGRNAQELSTGGLGVAAVGGILLVTTLISMAAGIGVMKSAKWGFILGAVIYGLSLLGNLVRVNIIGLVIAGSLFTYCVLRLTGKQGPKPV